MGADQRVQHLHWVLTMAPEDAVAYYYPRVLPLHTIEENDTELPGV